MMPVSVNYPSASAAGAERSSPIRSQRSSGSGETALATADAGPDLQKDKIINGISTHRRMGVFTAAVVAPLSEGGSSSDAGSAGAGSTTVFTGATAGVATTA